MDLKNYFKLDPGRIYSLDVLRAIAITSVILYHWPRQSSQMILRAISHYGYLGVDLFFVLSGYLIVGQSLARIKKQRFSISSFYLRRFMRTLPNYYLVILIGILAFGLHRFDWRYLFFLQNFGGPKIFSFTWSLCVEEHFYLFIPLLLWWMNKKNQFHLIAPAILLITLCGLILRAFLWFHYRPDLAYAQDVELGYGLYFDQIFYPSYCRLDGLALGSLVAYLENYRPQIFEKAQALTRRFFSLFCFVLAVVLLAMYKKVGWFNSIVGYLAISLCFTYLLIYSLTPANLLEKIKIPGITLISILSYALYLTHGFGIHLVHWLEKLYQLDPHGLAAHSLRVVLIFLCAASLYWGIEKPLLLIRNKLLAKRISQ